MCSTVSVRNRKINKLNKSQIGVELCWRLRRPYQMCDAFVLRCTSEMRRGKRQRKRDWTQEFIEPNVKNSSRRSKMLVHRRCECETSNTERTVCYQIAIDVYALREAISFSASFYGKNGVICNRKKKTEKPAWHRLAMMRSKFTLIGFLLATRLNSTIIRFG